MRTHELLQLLDYVSYATVQCSVCMELFLIFVVTSLYTSTYCFEVVSVKNSFQLSSHHQAIILQNTICLEILSLIRSIDGDGYSHSWNNQYSRFTQVQLKSDLKLDLGSFLLLLPCVYACTKDYCLMTGWLVLTSFQFINRDYYCLFWGQGSIRNFLDFWAVVAEFLHYLGATFIFEIIYFHHQMSPLCYDARLCEWRRYSHYASWTGHCEEAWVNEHVVFQDCSSSVKVKQDYCLEYVQ